MSESKENMGKLSFEAALRELEGITEKLEIGNIPLEEAVSIYERSTNLHRHCQKLLKAAELRINKISMSEGVVEAELWTPPPAETGDKVESM